MIFLKSAAASIVTIHGLYSLSRPHTFDREKRMKLISASLFASSFWPVAFLTHEYFQNHLVSALAAIVVSSISGFSVVYADWTHQGLKEKISHFAKNIFIPSIEIVLGAALLYQLRSTK